MISISISEEFEKEVNSNILEVAAKKVLEFFSSESSYEVAIVIDSDELLQKLNLDYLGIDAPTDVLSFPSGAEIDPDSNLVYLGDILVSYPKALFQAQAAGHTVNDELQLLIVHGMLHLFGYDHSTVLDRENMWKIQDLILGNLGCNLARRPGE